MYRSDSRRLHPLPSALVVVGALLAQGCAIETIDHLLEVHGVTWEGTTTESSESSGESSTTGSSSGSSSGSSESGTSVDAEGSASGSSGASTGTTEDASATDTGTTAEEPVCGDGVVEGEETCDDMNEVADDGCNNACARDSVVFITSQVYDGAMDGLVGADQRCRVLAAQAQLPRFETYRAWLSTSTSSAASRLLHSRGRYVLVNGLVVALDWDGLTSGALLHPIDVDEKSQTQDYVAWTGTQADGQPAYGSEFCGDWSSDLGSIYGGTGISYYTDAGWTYFEDVDCSFDLHLYCVEQ